MDLLDQTGVTVDSFQRILSARIDLYGGQTIKDQVDSLIRFAPVVVFGRSCCPFTVDSIHLLSEIYHVHTHVVHLDAIPDARAIIEILRAWSGRRQVIVPSIFVKGQLIGGCEALFRLNHNQTLELVILRGLINRTRTVDANILTTAKLPPPRHVRMTLPLLLFPPIANNHVSRITSLFIVSLSVVGASFYYKDWEPYISLTLLLDFTLRLIGGEASSPFAMLATVMVSLKTPLYAPGAAKQLDATFGFILSSLVTLFSFLDFSGHDIVACVLLVMLALASGLEGFLNVSLGSQLVEPGIRHGIFPPHIYRVYNYIRPEAEDTYKYLFNKPANLAKPVRITTDRTSPVALRYKKKSSDWKQHDWDALRHLHVHYLFCPLSLAALAMAFKISADTLEILGPEMSDMRFFVVPNTWFSLIACFGAFVLVFMLFLFITKIMLYPQKLRKERTHPLRGASLSTISIAFMIFGFLCYDKLVNPSSNKYSPGQVLGRVFFWVGSLSQMILSIAAVADWIGRPFTLESIQPHWLIHPIGLGIASFTAPVVEPLPNSSEASSESTRYIAELYFSFGWLLWIVLFTLSFLKVVLQPIPDNRVRHGVWFWLAAPCVMGLSDFFICFSIVGATPQVQEKNCTGGFSAYYFEGILLCLTLLWTCAPHIRFLSVEPFNMWYVKA
jgi:tellurite resistance protein TehA-like permease/glutaredoxin-related protein